MSREKKVAVNVRVQYCRHQFMVWQIDEALRKEHIKPLAKNEVFPCLIYFRCESFSQRRFHENNANSFTSSGAMV